MDVDLEKRINEAIETMQQILPEAVDIYQLDPMAKIMLVALVSETSKILHQLLLKQGKVKLLYILPYQFW